ATEYKDRYKDMTAVPGRLRHISDGFAYRRCRSNSLQEGSGTTTLCRVGDHDDSLHCFFAGGSLHMGRDSRPGSDDTCKQPPGEWDRVRAPPSGIWRWMKRTGREA